MNSFEDLLSQPQTSGVHPEVLEMLGRKASQLFQQGMPLNQAITKVVANHPELENEHVKRVVEFANTVTFQELFSKSEDKNIHFDVADPGVVLRDLKDGGSPAHDGKTLSSGMGDYHSPPREAGMPDELEQTFDAQFDPQSGPAEHIKEASEHTYHENPVEDLYEVHTRLKTAREKLAEVHERFSNQLSDARQDLYRAVTHEIIDDKGAGLGGVLGALEKVASRSVVAAVMTPMTEELFKDLGADLLRSSLYKQAGKVVNPSHPIVQHFAGMAKIAEEVVRSREAILELDIHLEKTGGALTSAVKGMVHKAPKNVPGGVRQRFSRK